MGREGVDWEDIAGRLGAGIEGLSFAVDAGLVARMTDYLRLLSRWNRVYNLTAVVGPGAWVERHCLDCLAIVPHLKGRRVLDVGTGAGLPGMILALARPDWEVIMVDRSRRKVCFVEQAIAMLGLDNARVVHGRVEACAPDLASDCIVSRAFTGAEPLMRQTRHLIRERGYWALMKGQRPDEELDALHAAGWQAEVRRIEVPGLKAERHLLVIEAGPNEDGVSVRQRQTDIGIKPGRYDEWVGS